MKNAGLPAPKFEDIRGNFTVTLYNSATEIDEADKEQWAFNRYSIII